MKIPSRRCPKCGSVCFFRSKVVHGQVKMVWICTFVECDWMGEKPDVLMVEDDTDLVYKGKPE